MSRPHPMAGLSISKKLGVLFFVFVLIFYGTVADLFVRVREMSDGSARIVAVNKQVAELAEGLKERLLDMETHARKYAVLESDSYFGAFESARVAYRDRLDRILALEDPQGPMYGLWHWVHSEYCEFTDFTPQADFAPRARAWGESERIRHWAMLLDRAQAANDDHMARALVEINRQSRVIVRNGVVGFGISILVGGLGVWFIFRSMLRPLAALKRGMARISREDYGREIQVNAGDEFGRLADTFNDMSRQLKAAEEIRSDFVATLSHEIRTPLSSMQESVNMMEEGLLGPVTDQQKKFLGLAGSGIVRIRDLLNHLMVSSAMGTQSPKGEGEHLSAQALVEEAVSSLSGSARSKEVAISLSLPETPVGVFGQGQALVQVLVNLIGNGIKFTPAGGKIQVGFSKGAGGVRFTVSDTGPGIPGDQHEMIFKRYYRSESVRRHADGVGLGLSIARRIVQDHGGEIGVENNLDSGATFWFTLPGGNGSC